MVFNMENIETGVYNNKYVVDAMLTFWVSLFGNAKSFLVTRDNGKKEVDREALEASLPRNCIKVNKIIR